MTHTLISFFILIMESSWILIPAFLVGALLAFATVKLAAGDSRLGAWLKAFFEL